MYNPVIGTQAGYGFALAFNGKVCITAGGVYLHLYKQENIIPPAFLVADLSEDNLAL